MSVTFDGGYSQFFLYIIIIVIILLIIRMIKVNFEIYEWQRATGSGVFVNASLPVTSLVVDRQ
jgi:hypothetical protein